MSNKQMAYVSSLASVMASEPFEIGGTGTIYEKKKRSHTLSNAEYKKRRKAELSPKK